MDDTSSSTALSFHVADTMEFTLEDTLEVLKELKLTRDEELERIYDVQINNKLFTSLSPSTDLLEEQRRLILSFMNKISNAKPDDYPIPETIDMLTQVISELVNEIENVEGCIQNARDKLEQKQEDITCLKEKIAGIEKMKEACLAANENIASKTYAQEIRITNQIFKEVRDETKKVVATLFPNHDDVNDFLATLCSAYFTSGDDVYVDLIPEVYDVANFLLEAGLLVYHRYDENKVRLIVL